MNRYIRGTVLSGVDCERVDGSHRHSDLRLWRFGVSAHRSAGNRRRRVGFARTGRAGAAGAKVAPIRRNGIASAKASEKAA